MAKKKTAAAPVRVRQLSIPAATRKVLSRTPEDVPTFYANSANFEASNFDIKIKLGQIESGTPEELRIVEIAHVYMSHEHARAFLAAFASAMEQFFRLQNPEADAKKEHVQ